MELIDQCEGHVLSMRRSLAGYEQLSAVVDQEEDAIVPLLNFSCRSGEDSVTAVVDLAEMEPKEVQAIVVPICNKLIGELGSSVVALSSCAMMIQGSLDRATKLPVEDAKKK